MAAPQQRNRLGRTDVPGVGIARARNNALIRIDSECSGLGVRSSFGWQELAFRIELNLMIPLTYPQRGCSEFAGKWRPDPGSTPRPQKVTNARCQNATRTRVVPLDRWLWTVAAAYGTIGARWHTFPERAGSVTLRTAILRTIPVADCSPRIPVTDYAHILTRSLPDSRACAMVGGASRMYVCKGLKDTVRRARAGALSGAPSAAIVLCG